MSDTRCAAARLDNMASAAVEILFEVRMRRRAVALMVAIQAIIGIAAFADGANLFYSVVPIVIVLVTYVFARVVSRHEDQVFIRTTIAAADALRRLARRRP